jgi:hypothetical protein
MRQYHSDEQIFERYPMQRIACAADYSVFP